VKGGEFYRVLVLVQSPAWYVANVVMFLRQIANGERSFGGLIEMSRYEGRRFQHQTVSLDHDEYINCIFEDCRFTYRGSAPVHLNGSEIKGGTLLLSDNAANTVEFLSQLRKTGLRHEVRQILRSICEDLRGQEPQ